ncbi:DUF4373 domain-containing protein [Chitinophaga sp. Hz27]|uniref:DUF4373 domain-containing protein n=1 Tax=Chitinophaga sp. Hz27 TaxID=3347169 RepID=UPI0035DB2770
MARIAEPGISYYAMKVAHIRDPKVRLIINEFGEKGYWIWQCILASAYENKGYYFDLKDREAMELFATEVCRTRVSVVDEVITGLIRRSLFDKGVADTFGVLSSKAMQEVYIDATAERRRKGTKVEIISDYFLLSVDEKRSWNNVVFTEESRAKTIVPRNNSNNPRNNDINPRNYPQSKEEKSKEEKTKGKKPSAPEVPADSTVLSLEQQYKLVDNNSKELVFRFIRDNNPQFIQPYVDFWNLFAKEYDVPAVTTINKARKKHFSVRIKEDQFELVEIIRKAKTSQFLLTSKWFTFDWLIKNDLNYLKVLEGHYDNKQQQISEQAANTTYAAERARIEERTRSLSQR